MRTALILASSLLVAACARLTVPPSIQPAEVVDVPAGWSSGAAPSGASVPADGATDLTRWWQRFGDPELDRLVLEALQANPSLAAARASVLQARALRELAAAALWPNLSGSASVQQGSAGGHSTGRQLDVGLAASWVPDLSGANRNALQAATTNLQAAGVDAGGLEQTVAAEVALSYLLLRVSQARLGIAEANLTSQEDTLQIATWREQAGLATALDTAQARTVVEQTRALLPGLRSSVDQTRHALAVLTGRPPAALQARLAAVKPIPGSAVPLVLRIPADTLRQRPDVRAAGLRVSTALAQVSQAAAARFPGFAISGSLGLGAAGAGALFESSAVLASVLAAATLPLFDGGAIHAGIHLQEAGLLQARIAYQTTVLTALREVEDALLFMAGDRDRLVSLQTAADAAAAAAAMSRQRYVSGLIDFQVVLDTQRTQLLTEDALATGTADVSSDLVRLCLALGGGWHAADADLGAQVSPAAGWVWSP